MIREFSLDGSVVGSFGRRGRGPGEFLQLSSMAMLPDRWVVVDVRQGRSTSIPLDGSAVTTESLRPPDYSPKDGVAQWRAPVMPAAAGRFVWVGGVPARRIEELPVLPVIVTDAEGRLVDTLPSIHRREKHVALRWGRNPAALTRVHHNGTRYDVSSNGRYYAVVDPRKDGTYVEVVELETLERYVTTLQLEPVPVPERVLERRARGLAEAIGGAPADELREELSRPRRVYVEHMAVLDDGTVMVSRPAFEGDTRLWYILELPAGTVDTVHLPVGMEVLTGSAPEIWARDVDALGVPYVVKLELRTATRDAS